VGEYLETSNLNSFHQRRFFKIQTEIKQLLLSYNLFNRQSSSSGISWKASFLDEGSNTFTVSN